MGDSMAAAVVWHRPAAPSLHPPATGGLPVGALGGLLALVLEQVDDGLHGVLDAVGLGEVLLPVHVRGGAATTVRAALGDDALPTTDTARPITAVVTSE